mgnify:CR=1 FL=1
MATQIGIVKALFGTATATAADGTIRNLKIGDQVFADELISTGADGAIELEFADGSVMDLGRDSQALLDNAVFNSEAVAETAASTDSDADAIQAAILAGADPTQVTEATAAGAGTQADGNEGHQPVVIDYLAPEVTPTSGFDTTGISVAFPEIIEELQAPIDEAPVVEVPVLPSISINDVTVTEPDDYQEQFSEYQEGPYVIATFTVTLSAATTQNVTVQFTTADGTAISGGIGVGKNDYGSTSGTLTIPAGSTTGTIQVYVFGDRVTEITEQFLVNLSAPVNAVIADGQGVGTILDNDSVDFAISSTYSISEDAEETATFTVNMSGQLAEGVTASVVIDLGAGTATDSVDYTAFEAAIIAAAGSNGVTYNAANNTLTFDDTFNGTFSFTVDAINDQAVEGTETIIGTLTGASISTGAVATITVPSTTTNITENDTGVSFAISSTPSISEDLEETATFTVTMVGTLGAGETATVDINLGAGTATDGVDYTAFEAAIIAAAGSNGVTYNAANNTLTFDDTFNGTFNFTVHAINDQAVEGTETIIADLSNATVSNGTASITTPSTTTDLTEKDAVVSFAISSTPSISEDLEQTATFTVDLTGTLAAGETASVVINLGAGTATDGVDYNAFEQAIIDAAALETGVSYNATTNTLTFDNTSDNSFSFSVTAINDSAVEGTETIIGTLSGATVSNGTATITVPSTTTNITENDDIPRNPVNDTITVEEESIPGIGGNNEDEGLNYTATGTFANNADWGANGFGGIVSVNGATAIAGVITITSSAWTLVVTAATGAYTFTMTDNLIHPNVAGENQLTLPAFNVVAQDGDGDTIGFNLNVNVVDDIPTMINPTTSHLKDVATSPDVVQLLNFAAGADGVGSVKFDTGLQGTAAVDAGGNELTFNGTGDPLYVNFSADGTQLQFVTKNLDGTLNTSDVKFFINLNQDGQTYSVHSEGIINNGTAVTATDLSSVGGGNVVSKVISNLDGTTQDVVMTTAAGKTVNTNNSSIGIGTQNAITVGEAIRFDFTNGTVAGNGGNATYTYDGTHNLTNAFTQQINKTTAGTTLATITVSAILADADNIFYGDTTGESLVGITTVKVYSGTLAQVQAGTAVDQTANVTITHNVDGTVKIAGLQEGWIYQVQTNSDFSAVNVAVDAGNIKLGVFSYGLQSDGQPIELDYGIIGTDGDGDFVTGSLGVNLYADGSTLEGNDSANTLTGTDKAEFLLGRGGDDILSGGGGDDLLIGGYGNDIMDGGAGKDTFVFSLAANSGNDTINNFEAGTDKLSFIDILDTDGSGSFSLNDVINDVSDSGGDITVSLTNGGSITLTGLGGSGTNDIAALQTLLGATNITYDVS